MSQIRGGKMSTLIFPHGVESPKNKRVTGKIKIDMPTISCVASVINRHPAGFRDELQGLVSL